MDFDDFAAGYSDTVDHSIAFSGQDSGFFARLKAEVIAEVAAARLGPPETLSALDVGCGVGTLTELAAGRFGRVSATDVSTKSLEKAAARLPGVDCRLSAPNGSLPFDDAGVDVAYAVCVFHHVAPEERPALAGEMLRVVRPGGLIMLFEHNPANPLTRHAVRTCPLDADARLLGAGEAARLLRQAGGAVVETRYIAFLPVDTPWARAVERRLGWLPLGGQYAVVAVRP